MRVRWKHSLIAAFVAISFVGIMAARAGPIDTGPAQAPPIEQILTTGNIEGPPASIVLQSQFVVPRQEVAKVTGSYIPIVGTKALLDVAMENAQNTMQPAPKWMVLSVPTKIHDVVIVKLYGGAQDAISTDTVQGGAAISAVTRPETLSVAGISVKLILVRYAQPAIPNIRGGAAYGDSLATATPHREHGFNQHTAPRTLII
jgi:hypothetical protein